MTTKQIQDLYKELHELNENIQVAALAIEVLKPVKIETLGRFKYQMEFHRTQLLEDIKEAQHEKLTK